MAFRRSLPLVLLAMASIATWCALTDRWSIAAWQTPLQLDGDPLEIYARIQAASEDLSQPLRGYPQVARLGAPLGADWTRYPISDRIVFTALGALARLTDVFLAINLAMAAVHALNAIAFYLCARFLRWRIEWAFALALLFSFSSYNFRWGVTVSFSLTFFVPPLLLLCGWIARAAPGIRPRGWIWLAVALGAWLGGANPYFAYFAAPIVLLSAGLQLAGRRDRSRLLAGGAFLGSLIVSFFLHNLAYFLAERPANSVDPVARNYAGSEIYALKLTDLVIPPQEHVIPVFGTWGRIYREQTALPTEFFVNYLGIAGLAGLTLLVWTAFRALAASRPARRLPPAFLGLVWFLAFSAVGGLNSLFALGGFDLFRATNRGSICLLVWSLLFLGAWIQRRALLHRRVIRWLAPGLVATVGVMDSVPMLPASALLRHNAAVLRETRQLMAALEARLGAGARIFQLPATAFPEVGPVGSMGDYEHFLPYLTSETLRFSYGAYRDSTLAYVQGALAQHPARDIVRKLQAAGFRAVWIDQRAYPGEDSSPMNALRALGVAEFAQTTLPRITIFLLQPATAPRRELIDDPDLLDPWVMIQSFKLAAAAGWYPAEHDRTRAWRWAQNDALMTFDLAHPSTVRFSFVAYSRTEGELVLQLDDREVWRRHTTRQTREPQTLAFDLPAGRHHLRWHYTGPLKRAWSGDPRSLGFALEDVRLDATRLKEPRMDTNRHE